MNNLSIKQEIERRRKLFNAITYVDIAVGVTAGQLRELVDMLHALKDMDS